MFRLYVALIVLATFSITAAAQSPDEVRLHLPPEIYAVSGQEVKVRFENLMLVDPGTVSVVAESSVGSADDEEWSFTPGPGDVGTHALTIRVHDASGSEIAAARTAVVVSPAPSGGRPDTLRLLIVGNSLTAAGHYPYYLVSHLEAGGQPVMTIGSQERRGVRQEGHSGRTWTWFASDPESPFYYPAGEAAGGEAADAGRLDALTYLAEHAGGRPPHVVTISLGVNDIFSPSRAGEAGVDWALARIFTAADALIDEIRRAAPHALIGIVLTQPPNDRPGAFYANYQDSTIIGPYRRAQHRLVREYVDYVQAKGDPRLFLIPAHVGLHRHDEYAEDNAVHPNDAGYRHMARSFYAALARVLDAGLIYLSTDETPQPERSALEVYPNPADGPVTVEWAQQELGRVTVEMFDLLGRRVGIVADRYVGAGPSMAEWDASGMPGGVYFVRVADSNRAETRGIMIAR